MNPVRILLVDDHAVVREGLRAVLQQRLDLRVVGEAGDADSALRLYRQLRPDVAIVDLHLPDGRGIDLIARIRRFAPDARVCVLSAFDARADIEGAIAAGARGYVVKAAPADEIVDAVRRLHAGLRAIEPRLLPPSRGTGATVVLTPREVQILRRVAGGSKNRGIAAALGISLSTVKFHLRRLMEKLGASDRTQAAAIALREGILRD